MNDVFLVGCVRMKLSLPAPARDIYRSTWFRKARAYVERTNRPWYILSAKYGLVRPDETIEPYDQTLGEMRAAQRRFWADDVVRKLRMDITPISTVVILAGTRYREFLVPGLVLQSFAVSVPMKGLAIGQQMRWLEDHTARNASM